MRIVIKTVIAVLVLFVLVVVLLPLGIGHWLEGHSAQYVQSLNKQSMNYQVKLVNFHRGWFTSTAQLELVAAEDENKFTMAQTFYQGPFVLVKDAKGSYHLHFAKLFMVATSQQANLQGHLSAALSFGHHIHGKINIPSVKSSYVLQRQQGHGHIQLKRMKFIFKGRLTEKSSKLTLRGDVGQVIVQLGDSENANTMSFSNLYMNAHLHKFQQLWYGHRFITIKKMAITQKGHPVFSLANLQLNFDLTHQKDQTALHMKYNIGQLTAGKKQAQSAVLDASVKKINTVALLSFYHKMLKIQKNIQATLSNKDLTATKVGANQLSQSQQFKKAGLKFLSSGFVVDINQFQLKTKDGIAHVQANVDVPAAGDGQFNLIQFMFTTVFSVNVSLPSQWVQKMAFFVYQNAKVPAANKMAAAHIKDLIKAKMLIKKDNNYFAKINYEKGQLKVNGSPPDMKALQLRGMPRVKHRKHH